MNVRIAKAGFTLVEVALSLLVLSVGLLAVMGLLPDGLRANKRAIDDTAAAMFAEEVINGYKAMADITAWDNIRDIVVEPRSPDMWVNASGQRVERSGEWRTVTYRPQTISGQGSTDFAMRYRLFVDEYPGQGDHRAYIRLDVLAGEFGPEDDFVRFYSELYNSNP